MNFSNLALGAFSAGLALAAAGWRTWQPIDPAFSSQNSQISLDAWRGALRRDNASCWRWGDLAWALADAGQTDLANRCYERALELGPHIPAIWMSDANFLFLHNEPEKGLQSAAHVLEMVPDYDGGIFNDFDMLDNPRLVLSYIGGQRRATNAWLQHLIALNRPATARLVWNRISAAHFADDALAGSYADYLLRINDPKSARQVWGAWLGNRRGDYPDENLLYNGDFEAQFLPSVLDWHIDNSDQFETVRDSGQAHTGSYSIRIRFNGESNAAYNSLSQIVVLSEAGTYRLSAWMKTEGITTNEGLRLGVAGQGDLVHTNVTSDSVTGTQNWAPVSVEFTIDQPGAVRVSLARLQSLKFDNKIQGSAWIDGVRLVRNSGAMRSARRPERG